MQVSTNWWNGSPRRRCHVALRGIFGAPKRPRHSLKLLYCSELDGFFNLFSGDGGNASKNGSFHEVSEEYGIMSGNGTFHPYKDNEDFVTLFVCAICWMVFWIAFCAFFEWLGCRKAKREAEKLAALEELADWTEFDRHLGREKYAYERLKTV